MDRHVQGIYHTHRREAPYNKSNDTGCSSYAKEKGPELSFSQPKTATLLAEVIGLFTPVNETLFLTKMSYRGTVAYALLSKEQYYLEFHEQPQLRSENVLEKRRQRVQQGVPAPRLKSYKLLNVASDATYGLCICPPHWKVMELNAMHMSGKMINDGLFSAVVEVEWRNGDITWEILAESAPPAAECSTIFQTLNRLGQYNEEMFRTMVTARYIDFHGWQ